MTFHKHKRRRRTQLVLEIGEGKSESFEAEIGEGSPKIFEHECGERNSETSKNPDDTETFHEPERQRHTDQYENL